MVNEIIAIGGRRIECLYKDIDIYDLRFYRHNPRISSILAERKGAINDETIDAILWERNSTHKLYRNIEKSGGLQNPITVYKNDVLEGNTRLCCYRHLKEADRGNKWERIPAREIVTEITRDEIYRFLCVEHVEGKIDWGAFEKGNLYYSMNVEEGMTYDQISELVGLASLTVGNKVRAYKLMLQYSCKDDTKYSHFEQLVINGEIKKIVREKDPDIEEKIVELIINEEIPVAQDIRKIPDIYKDKRARKRLFEQHEDFNEIYWDLKARKPDTPFMRRVEELLEKLNELPREDRDELCKPSSSTQRTKIKRLTKGMINLCNEIDIDIRMPRK